MHQPSILQFFGSTSSTKNDKKNPKNIDEGKEISKAKSSLKGEINLKTEKNIKDLSPLKMQKKRKTLLESDSDSNDFSPKKSKILASKDSENQESLSKIPETLESEIKKIENTINTLPNNYDPMKVLYNIVNDACWKVNEKVPYLALAKTFEVIEMTTKRLEITRTLSNFFRSVICLSPDDLIPCVYLCLNKVSPDYEGVEFGIGESIIMKALSQSTDTGMPALTAKMKKEGDLGQIAYDLPTNQRFLIKPAPLTVASVFKSFKTISEMSGKSAQNNKITVIKGMLNACSKCERKYIVRSLLGKLRIRLAEQTVLAAIGQAFTLSSSNDDKKSTKKSSDVEEMKVDIDRNTATIKKAFCECPNYDQLIKALMEHGVDNLANHCSICPGIPVKPMLAHPSKGVSEIFKRFDDNDFTCEYKYDGERAQIHVSTDSGGKCRVQIFSRNQEDNTSKYPDIVSLFDEMLSGTSIKSCIIDSEAVGWDRETESILPFQMLSTRKRKDVVESDIKIQVCIYAFDIILFNGQSLVQKSFRERRAILRENLFEIPGKFMLSTSLDSCKTDEISEFLEQSIRDKCEGLMIKTLDKNATYEISKRSHNWLKLKKDYLDKMGDTVDLVVIGASYGTGKRASKYGTFLLACYEPQSELYQTICKLGTGFSDEDLDKFYLDLKETVIRKPGLCYEYDKSCKPDCWFDPKYVWEVKAADLSISPDHRAAIGLVDKEKGISLRFPRFIRVRDDKKPENATTSRQIAEMYQNQDVVKNSINSTTAYEEDEFY